MAFQHGTSTGYNYHKCRCDECVAWKKERRKLDYERNRDSILAKNKTYQEAHKEELAAKATERRHRNIEQNQEYQRQYRQTHAEEINAKNRAWRARNHWKAVAHYMRNHGREYAVPLSDEVFAWIQSLGEDEKCTYCDALAREIDHVVPISKGGLGVRGNLTPCCRTCNLRKRSMDLEDWLRRLRGERA